MKNRKQRGVALLFALGMLTLLLVTGMAFVANALSARKVAANNSARTQARMFALSAMNRALASVMIYQYQFHEKNGNFPEDFAHICSVSTVNDTGDNDGLQTTGENAVSLMELPIDDSIVAQNLANEFNKLFLNSHWKGEWVYFYDKTNTSSPEDHTIIGRAAWQVLSTSPQISAPVFFSGHLPTDGTPGWKPRENRWGREIDEVYHPGESGTVFEKVADIEWNEDTKFENYDAIYSALRLTDNEEGNKKKRFIDKWLSPDVEGNITDPTPIVPEVYSYQENDNGKKIQVLRFNISEISKEDLSQYGVGKSSDPWYARFGVDSSSETAVINQTGAIQKLTRDGAEFQSGDKYDYELDAKDRPSLPFLRRIGNKDVDKPTFASVIDWRKQIAANFNDYCDADSVPTSDVAADTWINDLTLDDAGNPTGQPKYTGNEKTPYIYELGFNMAIHPGTGSAADASRSGFELGDSTGTGDFTKTPDIWLTTDAIVKLANIYPFDTTGFEDFSAGVDLGKIEVDFKPVRMNINFTYEVDGLPTMLDLKDKVIPEGMAFNTAKLYVDGKNYGTLKLKAAADEIKNTDGTKAYPVMIKNETGSSPKHATLDGNISFKLNETILKDLATLPDGAKLTKFTITVTAVEIHRVAVKVNRVYLAGKISALNKVYGLDYVRAFDNSVEWKVNTANAIMPVALPVQEDTTKVPGFLVGGIRNYDPRQNLNSGDWYQKLDVYAVDSAIKKNGDSLTVNQILPGLNNVMSISSGGAGEVNKATGYDTAKDAADLLFRPYPEMGEDVLRDMERAAEPGWKDEVAGADAAKHISTAFIRNAPMMSPWEIGFIHRGVRWQTLNIKNACDPDDNTKSVRLTAYKPGDSDSDDDNGWNASGTSYEGGDGGILDQIKMTDQCSTYGKINVNKLRTNYPEYNEIYDPEIIKCLFKGVTVKQHIVDFYSRSTRINGDFPNTSGSEGSEGSELSNFDEVVANITQPRDVLTSRAQFLDVVYNEKDLSNGFGATSDGDTDAVQEEIIGKTINLLCAESSTPNQIQMVVVAQAIRDVAGTQYRKKADGGNVNKECAFGVFDRDGDVYFDEITGEVKMFVTIDRDINTGRMTVRRIDYLE